MRALVLFDEHSRIPRDSLRGHCVDVTEIHGESALVVVKGLGQIWLRLSALWVWPMVVREVRL